jgi:predicted MarR family transcription regulator
VLPAVAQARIAKEQKKLEKQAKKQQKSGPGVGGWFLIGAGVASLAAVGYALWQTFRADDDLWIADEELDAPVKTVTNN